MKNHQLGQFVWQVQMWRFQPTCLGLESDLPPPPVMWAERERLSEAHCIYMYISAYVLNYERFLYLERLGRMRGRKWTRSLRRVELQALFWVHMTVAYYHSLVPRPRPAFCRLQYGKAWRAWYLFSCEHDVIGKWWKFSEQTGCVLCIFQLTTRSTLGVYNNRHPLARYVR